jgi:hypothetical protein
VQFTKTEIAFMCATGETLYIDVSLPKAGGQKGLTSMLSTRQCCARGCVEGEAQDGDIIQYGINRQTDGRSDGPDFS